jgi:ABC-type antimicrobial peptide transport system permease subunit
VGKTVQCIQTSLFLPISDALLPMHQPVFIDPPTGRSERILTVAYSPRPGVVGSLAVLRLVNSFLFGVSATDPFVYAAAVVTMMVMALLASALQALRAASADPIDALRSLVWTVSVTRYLFG